MLFWLEALAAASLGLGVLGSAIIAVDILRGNRQARAIMNFVWPITAFYMPLFGLWVYRTTCMPVMKDKVMRRPFWQQTFISTSHCGAGCTYGDIIGEFTLFFLGVTFLGVALYASFLVDFVLAYGLGVFFQYFAIAEMNKVTLGEGLKRAVKADTLSLVAFQAGLFIWMAIVYFILFNPPLNAGSPVYWLMMQVGMCIGFLTSVPANVYLLKKGIKEIM